MIQRTLLQTFQQKCSESKIVVLRGPKSSGRTTLVESCFDLQNDGVLLVDCVTKSNRKTIEQMSLFREIVATKKVVILKEAQLIPNLQELIDWCIELDHLDNLILLCSFEPDLHEALWEALRDAGLELNLFPLSYSECAQHFGLAKEDENLEQRLIYGNYPAIVSNEDRAEQLLHELLESSIFTQLGATERINKRDKLIKLLRHLSFNIGKVISFNDLGKKCGLDNETVERYVKLFDKASILFLLPSFYNEHRYELKKSMVVYFVDNGIRNALIRAFQPLEFRNDLPELWRNYVIAERYKANAYAGRAPKVYFWMTHTKQEIDYIEQNDSQIFGVKLQWEKNKSIKIPASFVELYPNIKVSGINRTTFWSFLQKK